MKNILRVLIGVIIVVLFIPVILLDRKIEKINSLTSEKEQLASEKEDLLIVRDFRNAEILFNGKELIKNTYISDGKGNSIEWNEIIDNNTLVFYFSETSCDMCIDMEIARLNEKTEPVVSNNTIILISAISKRYVAQYKNNNKLQFPVYEIKSGKEDFLPSLPFYFIIDKESKRINSSFFPSKYTPDETDKYLSKIAEDYFR
jgi:peroxiredoxin